MNAEFAQKYISEHKERVFNLFSTYQMIETLLFMKLNFPEKEKGLDALNKELSRNTLGSLKQNYDAKFPKDDFEISELIEICRIQRNSFMHSFWILLALFGSEEDGKEKCDMFFVDFEKNSSKLMNKVTESDFE